MGASNGQSRTRQPVATRVALLTRLRRCEHSYIKIENPKIVPTHKVVRLRQSGDEATLSVQEILMLLEWKGEAFFYRCMQ
jgi:uncharacterized protein (UPF0248 family)